MCSSKLIRNYKVRVTNWRTVFRKRKSTVALLEHFTALFELSTNDYFVYFVCERQIFKLTYAKPKFKLYCQFVRTIFSGKFTAHKFVLGVSFSYVFS